MAELRVDGPIDIDPALAMALYRAMPEMGRQAVAQMFGSRLMSGPLSEAAVAAAARVYAERMKIGETSAKALREGVANKVREWGEKQANPERVREIVEDESRRAAAELARAKVESLLTLIPLEALISAVTPIVADVVKALAQQYFLKTQNGQKAVMELIEGALASARGVLIERAEEKVMEAAMRPFENRLASALAPADRVGDNGGA